MQLIGLSDLTSTRLGYGCWRLAGSEGGPARDPEEGRLGVITAFRAGYTFFDNADIYGRGECERIFGQALKEVPEMRQQILIATKAGIRPPWDGAQHCYDSSAEHLIRSAEESLKRMGIEQIDLFMIHRPDFLAEPDEIARAFAKLRDQGKVRWFGVSNFRPEQLSGLQRACDFPLVAHQIEISLSSRHAFGDGTLDQCVAEKMTPLAWSPLNKGALVDVPRNEREEILQGHLNVLAVKYHTTRAAIALAWLLRHPSRMIPVIGTVNPERIYEAARADEIELSREDWYALLIAARGERIP